jgi:ATP-binding cassette subfamily B multidrug efflux pump
MTAPAGTAYQQADDEFADRTFDTRLARRLLTYVAPYRALVAGSLAILLVDGVLQLAGPLLTRHVIDVAVPGGSAALIARDVVLFVGVLVLQFLAGYGETVVTALVGQRVMHDLRTALFAHLQRLSISFFDRNPVGRIVTRVTQDVESLNELFTAGVVAGLGDVFTLIAIGVAMVIIDWRLAIAAFVVVPIIAFVSQRFQHRVRVAYRDIRGKLARQNAFLQERLAGIRIVQVFGREMDERGRFAALNDDHLRAHLRSITYYALYFPAIEILTTVALATVIVTSTRGIAGGTLTIGTVAAFLQFARRFYQPLQDLSDKLNTLQQAMASAERVFRLMDERATVPDTGAQHLPVAPEAGHAGTPSAQRQGVTVEFEDVWFAYDFDAALTAGREPAWVLRGVSFSVRPGESLAIVGHTGAGKTTVVNLLLRFHDPQRGHIRINGMDIRDVPLAELRAQLAYVQQDIFLFAGDVASNIRLGSALSQDDVERAAARVGADRVIRRLPGGYAYEPGERGASLSTGERQLLAFARAIAADPALLVLDEATSAVDSELEAAIQTALAELMRRRTTIAIAHRLSTIVAATEILVLHHGEVRERGTHASLLSAGGLYERLYRLQAGELESPADHAA